MTSSNPGYVFGVFQDRTCITNREIKTHVLVTPAKSIGHKFEYKVNGLSSSTSDEELNEFNKMKYDNKVILRFAIFPYNKNTDDIQ